MAGWRDIAAVAVGGLVGTGIRLTLDTVIPHSDTSFPVSTLIINVVGSFALGLLVSTLWKRRDLPNWLRAGLGAGLVGSFTTFSAVIVSLIAESSAGEWGLAVGYLVVTLLLGFAAAIGGIAVGGRRPTAPDLADE
jgi:CrcB protein